MCWYTKNKPVEQEATSPITVYKILENTGDIIMSPVYAKYWTLDELDQLDDKLKVIQVCTDLFRISFGYHSLLTKPFCGYFNSHSLTWCDLAWFNGKTYLMNYGYNRYVYMCEIPVGAHYYVNEHDEVVSDKLIIRKKLENMQYNL